MLAYAYRVLREENAYIGSEDFENTHSLFAEIILRLMTRQIKRGIHRDYSLNVEMMSSLRGKIDISKTISNMSHTKRQLVCEYDMFTEDVFPNRVIKAAVTVLLRHGDLSPKTSGGLKWITAFLGEVKDVRPSDIKFVLLRTQRLTNDYKMLLSICHLLFDGLLMTEENGEYRLRSFLRDDKMHLLFEQFVREYFRHHHREFDPRAREIKWDLPPDIDATYLPTMRSDTTLSLDGRTVIIDTKWYNRTMSTFFGKQSYHSSNMYQIYSYVSNAAKGIKGNVSGVLLYAKTDEPIDHDEDYIISGNRISVKTLDLSQPFVRIQSQMEAIADILTEK